MTPAEADRRIILSRQTLARYLRMVRAGQYPVNDIKLMTDEMDLLKRIAYKVEGKWDKCERLAMKWKALLDTIRPKLN